MDLIFEARFMKILVAVKRVIDPYVKIRVKSDGSGIETQNIKMAMNPFDEIALEEAIRLKEQKMANEIFVISIGPNASQDTLRHALALGADRACLIRTDKNFCSLNIAKILKHFVLKEEPDLVLMGKQSIDGDNNQTPQMLAALLNWPQATFASKILMSQNELEVTREVDGGLQTIRLPLKAVVSTDLRLNEPRYTSLPNIMKAKQKPLEVIELETLGLQLKEHRQVLKLTSPAARERGIMVGTVDELIQKLKYEAKVL